MQPVALAQGELMQRKEGEDEAMERYKARLIKAEAAITEDPRRVVVTEMIILLAEQPCCH